MGASCTLAHALLLAAVLVPGACLQAQAIEEVLAIETAAAKAAAAREPWRIDTRPLPTPKLVLAPVVRYGQNRPRQRTDSLAARLGAAVGGYADVFTCDTLRAPCPLRSATVLLLVAEPVIAGDSARVTVTSRYRNPREEGYETVEFHLVRQTDAWVVVKALQIGIS